ncbi:PREDICTED: AP-5 complex subunit mu [Tarenaya hassleriana]|uniref:AP-5 complex subunit mu n=1 Tax=Tarenaya hassleriana TaxID=28532 RepID=UPI00053C2007|nr:PREDICTED: AP-5 complex subunit mu [Tarenaya hassleriana]XP_010524582.1 PREDICTED: AP-5 complex subunit mu [Tarenaya hassleriana]XP_010524583.1 PREDICTED: AP-5 complex subunit mu [Tarenaya hassleriana]XP_010524584.1 PREDICTED: AP-5 complex subunit mu [Tarenaya hassleriana]XP_010524585.1 PREDICTED: AP-5 complex subunit mu [Tarenaya hassleriana]
MPSSCSIRALWILNNQDAVVFSRRFPVVEKQWRTAFKRENGNTGQDPPRLPTDLELAEAFARRKTREVSIRGYGIRVAQSTQGSDSWVDDPITRHIISICIGEDEEEENHKDEEGDKNILWPLILHTKGLYCILVLPLVEPRELKDYIKLCRRSDCGPAVGEDLSLSSLLLDIPSITGAFMVAHAFSDVISGDTVEPEVVVSASPSVGGLFDSLTGSIGISSRAKPVAAPVASSSPSGAAVTGAAASDAPKIGSRSLDKDLLRNFITSAIPFGTPLDLNFSNIFAIKANGFSSVDPPPQELKQPAWKPYLYKGKQRLSFTIHETVNAAMYDRDEIPDSISIAGQINCRAELEGLPDVSFPLTGLSTAHVEAVSFHPCTQVPAHGIDKQNVVFQPPLGNFVLMRYQAACGLGPPVKGFYQLSMVSEDEGAFLFKLRLMEGYKAPLAMEFCTVTMPFPRRRIIAFDGTPSAGTVSTTEHAVEWKILGSGRSLSGKSLEATFPGTIKFSPLQSRRGADEESDGETAEGTDSVVNVEEFLVQKMSKDLPAAELEEPFCWQAYNYAKVSFKIVGASLSRMSIDTKSVNIYPATKAPVEFSTQVASGDYILWNTLGKCPSAATS